MTKKIMMKMMITTMTKTKILMIFLLVTVFLSVKGQENLFKEIVDGHKARSFCFYPSTLRMLNIGGNADFNNMVNGLEKLLVYKLDSSGISQRIYSDIVKVFKSKGYEEYVSINGGSYEASLLGSHGSDKKEYVGYFNQEDAVLAFYLKGDLEWEEIPKIFNSIKDGDFINILDLSTSNFENHP